MNITRFVLILVAALAGSSARAQLHPVSGDQRQADRDAIRAHIDGDFRGFFHQDAAALRASHSTEWRGFLEGSRTIRQGIGDYLTSASGELKSPEHIRA